MRINFKIPDELIPFMDEFIKEYDCTYEELITMALKEYIKNNKSTH